MSRVLIVSICLFLTACGVKPGTVSAPEGAEHETFPRAYPDISTDPAATEE